MITVALGIFVATLLIYLIQFARNVNKHWKNKGLKYMEPKLFFGNTLPVFMKKNHVCEIYIDLCKKFPEEPLLGFYDGMTPRLIVQDAEYIEKILIKDFQHFTDHGLAIPDEIKKPIDHYQLFTLTGAKWRAYRYKMSPLFTSGKLKHFYGPLDQCGNKIIKLINDRPKKDVDIADVMQLLIADFVGMAIFGLDTASIDDPDSEYHKMGKNVFEIGFIREVLMMMAPGLTQKLGVTFGKKDTIEYFCKVIQDAFKHREETGIKRNDFIQMMMQLRQKGKIEIQKPDLSDEYLDLPMESFEITDVSLMSQAYTFMTTGLDTVSISLQFCFYELARHPDIQKKTREEIIQQTKLYSGLTYEALQSMTYLGNVISESGRLHPIILAIFRVCTKDYTFPNGYKIKEGELLHIPVHSVHKNPIYFNDPLKFKPERFEYPMKPGTYFPFGEGPRVCIAMRFALLQMRYALAKMLTHYDVKLSNKTKLPFQLKPGSIVVKPVEPIYFDLTPL